MAACLSILMFAAAVNNAPFLCRSSSWVSLARSSSPPLSIRFSFPAARKTREPLVAALLSTACSAPVVVTQARVLTYGC